MIAGRAALDLLKDQVRLFDSGINAVKIRRPWHWHKRQW
jgi:hypothetical protein